MGSLAVRKSMAKLVKFPPPNNLMPTHRVLLDRRSNQTVGPPVPINPKDWPYRNLHPSEILWRYVDYSKFESMLRSSSLFLRGKTVLKIRLKAALVKGMLGTFLRLINLSSPLINLPEISMRLRSNTRLSGAVCSYPVGTETRRRVGRCGMPIPQALKAWLL
jgi:hypothetical protein